jgi:hypothetical protein
MNLKLQRNTKQSRMLVSASKTRCDSLRADTEQRGVLERFLTQKRKDAAAKKLTRGQPSLSALLFFVDSTANSTAGFN